MDSAPPRWRVTVFRIFAALAGLFFFVTIPQAISPWGPVTLSSMEGVTDPNLHRWSAALAGGPDLGLSAALLYLAWRALQAPLILQWVALAVIVFLVANVPFVGPGVAVIAIPIALTFFAYPQPRKLHVAPWSNGVDLPVLLVGSVLGLVLAGDAAMAFASQLRGADELAFTNDWASNGEHLINVGLAAALAGMRKPGARVLGCMAGAVVVFLGAASIAVPGNPGSWGTAGGWLAIAAGLAMVVVTVLRERFR